MHVDDTELVVYPNRRTLAVMAAVSFLFAAVMFFVPMPDGTSFRAVKTQLAMLVGIPFFSMGCVYFLWRLIVPTPLLIAKEYGLFLAGTMLSPGWLRWDEITDVRLVTIKGNQSLGIVLRDEQTTLERMNWSVRTLASTNSKITGGCAFHVSKSALPMPIEELIGRVNAYRPAVDPLQRAA
jgi:hypothetical protein